VAAFLHVVHAAEDERAEIKLLVQPNKIAEARRALNLTGAAEKHYKIYFVDTGRFDLNKTGLILRLRDEGSVMETTVKFRPVDSSIPLDEQWQGTLEKESEWLIGKGENLSYSLSHELNGPERIKNPSENLDILFMEDQKALFKKVTNHEFDPAELKVFGPIAAEIWEWREGTVDDKVSAELWTLGNEQIFELSRKTKANNLKEKADDFERAFKQKGIAVDSNPESKTRKALEYYSHSHDKHAKPGAAPSRESNDDPTADLRRVIETQQKLINVLKDRVRELEAKGSSSEHPE
jgi:hypothetical protein